VAVHDILKMGDPRLLRVARPVRAFDTPELHALVDELASPGDLWALCGSLPPGAPGDLYADLIAAVQARGARAILDTSEAALRLGLAARPAGIKPNSEEAAQALGQYGCTSRKTRRQWSVGEPGRKTKS